MDDLAVSGATDVQQYLGTINQITSSFGYRLAKEKTRFFPKSERQIVTGLVVNDRLRPTKEFIRDLRRRIRYCLEFGPEARCVIEGVSLGRLRQQLNGQVSHIQYVDENLGKGLRRLLYGVKVNPRSRQLFAGSRKLPTPAGSKNALTERLATPQLHEAGPRPQLSSDGWAAYRGAVDMAFANTVEYGQIIKNFQETEQPGRYGPPEIVATDRRPISKGLDPMTICTSHVERHNLSIRTFMRRFTRLALGFSKKLENLAATVALYVGHYNFCRWHGPLKMTPAMAAGITGHPWTMNELLDEAENE